MDKEDQLASDNHGPSLVLRSKQLWLPRNTSLVFTKHGIVAEKNTKHFMTANLWNNPSVFDIAPIRSPEQAPLCIHCLERQHYASLYVRHHSSNFILFFI